MTDKTRGRNYTGFTSVWVKTWVVTTVTFNVLSLLVCVSCVMWLWFMEKVTGRWGWRVGWKRRETLWLLGVQRQVMCCWPVSHGGKGLKWPVFLRNFRKAPRVGESCAAGMRIIQQRLSGENNYASDLCWDLCGLRSQTFERCQSCRCKQPPWISCDKQTCPLDLVFT